MNSEEFYGLMPGAIGTIKYRAKPGRPSEEQIASAQNSISSAMFSSYLANYQFTKGGPQQLDPQAAFEKARRDAREHAEELLGTVEMELHVQIGQEESINKIMQIESQDGFIGWTDPNLVNLIKTSR